MELAGGFFDKMHKQQDEFSFIDVGGEQFHAVAVALIDSLLTSQRGNDAALKKILERFYFYFREYATSQPYVTLSERMKTLLNNPRKSKLVECMAYVLRQLTIDELYADFLNIEYRKVFDEFTQDTKKNHLRDPETSLDHCVLKTFAKILGVSITLSFKEPGLEVRKRVVYNPGNQSMPARMNLTIQVQQGGRYFPAAKNKAYFAYVGQLAISAPKPAEPAHAETETLAEEKALIKEDNKRLLQTYNQWRKTILSIINDGELTCTQLRDLYIRFLPDQSESRVSIAALDHYESKTNIAGFPVSHEQYVTESFVNALADWITTEQIEPDRLFEQLEYPVSSRHQTAVPDR